MPKFGTSLADKLLGIVGANNKPISEEDIEKAKIEKINLIAREKNFALRFIERDQYGHHRVREKLALVPALTLFAVKKIPLTDVLREQWYRAIEIYDPIDAYIHNEISSLDALKKLSWDELNLAVAIETKKTSVDKWFSHDYMMSYVAATLMRGGEIRDLWDANAKEPVDYWLKILEKALK